MTIPLPTGSPSVRKRIVPVTPRYALAVGEAREVVANLRAVGSDLLHGAGEKFRGVIGERRVVVGAHVILSLIGATKGCASGRGSCALNGAPT